MIYVDAPTYYGYTPLRYKTWSHLWSDTSIEELHQFADRLGLRRAWFQDKAGPRATPAQRLYRAHYDVTPSVRARALRLGALPCEIDEFARTHPFPHKESTDALPTPALADGAGALPEDRPAAPFLADPPLRRGPGPGRLSDQQRQTLLPGL